MGSSQCPDIVLIVLDCVSARDFYGGIDAVPGLKAAQSLAREGVVYSRAVAPASWTLPSHASMFSGLYPWESGAYGFEGGERYFRGRTMAERLHSIGFQTGCFSANPSLNPESGLTQGFDSVYWGSWADCTLRKLTKWTSAVSSARLEGDISRPVDRIPKWSLPIVRKTIDSLPIASDVATRLISRALGGGSGSQSRVAPWIEVSVERWLTAARKDKPVFCFVNLLDAHEPFIGLPERISEIASWLNPLLIAQRGTGRYGNHDPVNAPDGDVFRRLYRVAIGILDTRLALLFQILQKTRDWDSTCVIVTGDHGQAFGEDDVLFHWKGIPDSVHRVPLIVKPVRDKGEHQLNRSWTTLRSLPSIIAATSFGDGPLGKIISLPFPNGKVDNSEPLALSLADGQEDWPGIHHGNGARWVEATRAIVGYSGEYKIVIDTKTLEPRAFALPHNGGSTLEQVSVDDVPFPNLKLAMEEAATMVHQSDIVRASNGVSHNLRSWGYE